MSEQEAVKPDPKELKFDPIDDQWKRSFADATKGDVQKMMEEAYGVPRGTTTLWDIIEAGDTNHNGFLTKKEIKELDIKLGATAKRTAAKAADNGSAIKSKLQVGDREARMNVAKGIGVLDLVLPDGQVITGEKLLAASEIVNNKKYELENQLVNLAGSDTKRKAIAALHDDPENPDKVDAESISVRDVDDYVKAKLALFGLDYLQKQSKNIDTTYGNANGQLSDQELSKLIDSPILYESLQESLDATRSVLREVTGGDPEKAIYTQKEIDKARQMLSKKLEGIN